jgi:stage III sporulation protein AG
VGLGLLLLPTGEGQEQPVPVQTVREESLEQRLEELLAQIEGAGAVRVLLTEDVGRETVWQTDVQKDADSVREDTVILEDSARNEIGLVRRITEPSYRGAVILCQGADAPSVKLAIVEAVRCVTGLGADQISVQKMN